MSDNPADLSPDEWLLRRLPPNQRLEKSEVGFRPSSGSFSPATLNGGISFNRAATLAAAGLPMTYECPDASFGVAAIQVGVLMALGLSVERTPPPPHHVDVFGLADIGGGERKRL